MKKITTLIAATMISLVAIAQQPYKVYCSVSARHSETSTTAISRVEIDYGQEKLNKNYLVDSSGTPPKTALHHCRSQLLGKVRLGA